MAVAAAPAGGGAAAPAAEEKTEFNVILASAGDKKIEVIKEVRAITGLGLKEAKDLVESAPKPVKEAVPKEEADQVVSLLKQDGRVVESHYYSNEGHGFLKRENQIDSIRRTIEWFERHLKPGAASSPR